MDWFGRISSYFLRQMALQYAVKRAQRKVTLLYLKVLQVMRRSLIAAFVVFFLFQLMVLGFFGAAVTAIWLYPTPDINTKLYLLLGFFAALFLIPALGLAVVFSDRLWFRVSGAQDMMKNLQ